MSRVPLLAASALLASAIAGHAAAQLYTPTQIDVCDEVTHKVDKNRLATFLLDAAPVSRKLEDWAAAHRGENPQLGVRQRMLADDRICDGGACKGDDRRNLATLRQSLITILTQMEGSYRNTTGEADPAKFFADPGNELVCVRRNGEPANPPGSVKQAAFQYNLPLRVRGSADGLHFERKEPEFAIQEAASFSITDDNVGDKKTTKYALVVGWPIINRSDSNASFSVIPYLGATRDLTKAKDKPQDVKADSQFGGLAFDWRPTTFFGADAEPITHVLTLRPEYRVSDADKDTSELFTLNLTYMPMINNRLNSFIRLMRDRDDLASWRPIFEMRAVAGRFTDRGERLPEESGDFNRLGGRVGFAVISNNRRWPFDLLVTETWLPSLGAAPDISHFQSKVSWALDPERIFTIDLTYGEGRRSDLLNREEEWKLSIGAKY